MEHEVKTKNGTESLEMFRGRLKAYDNISKKIKEQFDKLDPNDIEGHSWWLKFQAFVIQTLEEEKA